MGSVGEGAALSATAVDWLVGYAAGAPGPTVPLSDGARYTDAIEEFFRLLPFGASWQEAFAAAFGIGAGTFYERFAAWRDEQAFTQLFEGGSVEHFRANIEAYREAITAPLAHLNDDAVRRVVVFLGDVPQDVRDSIRADVRSVDTFLAERLGVSPYDYSVYFAADREAGLPVYYGLHRQGLLPSTYYCSIRSSGVVFHDLACRGGKPDLGNYFFGPFSVLRQGTHHAQPPQWLSLGIRSYATTVYRAEVGLLSYADELRAKEAVAARSSAPLWQLETHDGWQAAGNGTSWALSLLAIDRLAPHAGAPALIEYLRLLPRGDPSREGHDPGAGSWEAAFERAFGLTVDDFYGRLRGLPQRVALRFAPHARRR